MKLIVEPSHDLPLVSGVVAFKVGSSSDPVDKDGLARLTTRLLRRGTKKLGAVAVDEAIDRLGADLSSDASLGWLSISFEVLTRNAAQLSDLLARLLGEPSFVQDEIEKLLRSTEAEIIEARDNDRALAGRALRSEVYEGHPFSRRTAGSIASLKNITRKDVLAFHRKHFNRANAVVAISGDANKDFANELAERLLALLPEGEATPDPVREPSSPPGRRLVFVDKPDRTQSQLYIGRLGTLARDPDHTAVSVATTAFGGTFTAPLMREVRSERGWSYGASARLGLDTHRELFSVWTAPAAKDAANCLALELELLEAWFDKGTTKADLEFTKKFLLRSRVFDIDTASKRVQLHLEQALLDLPRNYHSTYAERVTSVTKAQADKAVRQRLELDDLVIAIVGTYREIGQAIERAIPRLDASRVVAFDRE